MGRILRIAAVVVVLLVAYDQLCGFLWFLGLHEIGRIDLRPWNDSVWNTRLNIISYGVGTFALVFLARSLWRKNGTAEAD